MATVIDDSVASRGIGFGGGDGFGGGGMGFILGALLARGGFGLDGRRDGGGCNDCATTGDLLQQTLGDIKASIPLSEADLQLAMAQGLGGVTTQANANTQYLGTLLNQLGLGQLVQSNAIQTAIASVDTNVDRQACATREAVHADGEATRALITANRIADLEQQLTVAQLREAEGRQIIREQENSHNVTVQVNQQQAQSQLQFQRLDSMFSHLLNGFNQVARATNSQVVVGSTGVAGTQTANPTNVAA